MAKGFHTFPKDISLKVNEREYQEFDLIYYDVVVQLFNHYATVTYPCLCEYVSGFIHVSVYVCAFSIYIFSIKPYVLIISLMRV